MSFSTSSCCASTPKGRKDAILPQILLSVAVAAMTTLWMPLTLVGVWLGGVLSALAFNWSLANRYLHQDQAAQKARNWQARFIVRRSGQRRWPGPPSPC